MAIILVRILTSVISQLINTTFHNIVSVRNRSLLQRGSTSFKLRPGPVLILILILMVLGSVVGPTFSSERESIHFLSSRAQGNVTVVGLEEGESFDDPVELDIQSDDPDNITGVTYVLDGENQHSTSSLPYTWTLDPQELEEGNHSLVVIVDHTDGSNSTIRLYFSIAEKGEAKEDRWFRNYMGASGGMMTCMLFLILNRDREFAFGVGAQFSEEQLKEKTKGAVIAATSKAASGPFSGPDVILMLVGLGALGLAFAYSTMCGDLGADPLLLGNIPTIYPPDFEAVSFLLALPVALLCGGVLIIGAEVVEWSAAKKKGITSHLTLWPVGLFSLALSSFLFLIPFGYPVKVKLSDEKELSKKDRGYLSLCVAVFLASMMLPFAILSWIPATSLLGGIGLALTIMLFCYTLVPIKPLEGRFIFKWNKPLWMAMFFSSMGMFVHWSTFRSMEFIYIGIGLVAAIGLVLLFVKGGGKQED
jgi:hypothetical protein